MSQDIDRKPVSEVRRQIEEALEKAGLGKKYDKEIPILGFKIIRDKIREQTGESGVAAAKEAGYEY